MTELRRDPVYRNWSVISPRRAKRPNCFDKEKAFESDRCPFDYGHEDKTPAEIFSIRCDGSLPDEPGWKVRVVPNLYPTLHYPKEKEYQDFGFYEMDDSLGNCELIVHTPDHGRKTSEFNRDEMAMVIRAYISRFQAQRNCPDLKYTTIFYNHGERAGASLDHEHSQLYSMSYIPPKILGELDNARSYHEKYGKCVFCRMLEVETAYGERMVFQNDHFAAFCPYASIKPFEVWILPLRHCADFDEQGEEEIASLADILIFVLRNIDEKLHDPPLNFYLHSAPNAFSGKNSYHWHFELFPRITMVAGFELATGTMINIISPEEAAGIISKITR